MVLAILAIFGVVLSGCPSVGQDEPSVYNYDDTSILITNPDWGVLPLVNNFLNPVKQAEIPVIIPGLEVDTTELPTTVALPIMEPAQGEEEPTAYDRALALGYPVVEDSDLTKALLAGMNKLDGFVKNVPIRIPFSKQMDMESLVVYDGTNAMAIEEADKAANFFFLDITDPEDIEVIEDFKHPFNYEMNNTYPYFLTLRMDEAGAFPKDYTPGHTYLIVVTGVAEDRAVKSIDGKPFLPDGFFSIFAAYDEDAYIGADGSIKNNLLAQDTYEKTLAAVQEAEGGRQITNYGLNIWEKLIVDDIEKLKGSVTDEQMTALESNTRTRNEVIAAFHFTTASNPFAIYFDSTGILFGPTANSFKVTPINYAAYKTADEDETEVVITSANACLDDEISFGFSKEIPDIKADSVDENSITLFKVEDGALSALSSTIAFDAETLKVVVNPGEALEKNTTYAVAVNNKIVAGAKNRPAIDETFFGITRPNTPLVDDTTWLSPHLDSRVDVLIAASFLNPGKDVSLFEVNPTEETLQDRKDANADASASALKVLRVLEEMRKVNAPFMPKLVEEGFVETLEDVVLFWTFTTGDGCE